MTCNSATDCWAVGFFGTTLNQTLIEHWNGTAWSIVSSPNTGATQSNYLTSVTCASTSDCWAVGSGQVSGVFQVLIEHWNGSAWSIATSPTTGPGGGSLSGVTCNSSIDCIGVGNFSGATNGQTLAVRWNGTFWFVVATPNTSSTQDNFLTAITCLSASECTASGIYSNGTVYQTLIERWNGTSWSIVSSPNSDVAENNLLTGISCVSASDCSAVGFFFNGGGFNQTLAEHWNGSAWSIVPSPNNSATLVNQLSAVACSSGTQCLAVGYANNSVLDQTLVERWDGTTWSVAASPNTGTPSPTSHNSLGGIACPSSTDCWATGSYDSGSSIFQTLIEHWNGKSWSVLSSPNTSPTQSNSLGSVECPSPSTCFTVGNYDSGSGIYQTLIEQWNGVGWSVIPSPNSSPSQVNALADVACNAATDCWASGLYLNGSFQQTLIEHWDGTSWSIISSPNTSASNVNVLGGIVCTSASNCWAVGYYNAGTVDQTLIERWNGTSWSIVASPNSSAAQHNELNDVTCASANDCWAVGTFNNGTQPQTLIEHWNGTAWAIITSPNTSATVTNALFRVTCTSSTDCIAVGQIAAAPAQTLVVQWNGTAWAINTSANSDPTKSNNLSAVACASASDCWSVGQFNAGTIFQTLIEKRLQPLLLITSVSRPANGHYIVNGNAVPLSTVSIQAVSDMSTPFTNPPLGTTTANGSGLFSYDDAGAIGLTKRFYRAVYP